MKEYNIKKSKHSSGLHFCPFFKNKLSFTAEFTDSCLYDLGNIDQLDINKLMGFSCGFHHKNSARIGWRAKGDLIEIVSYCYVNGVRILEETLGTVKPNEKFSCIIKDVGDIWMIQFKNAIGFSKVYVKKNSISSCGYMLYPYFGGNNVAPHDMQIKIKVDK